MPQKGSADEPKPERRPISVGQAVSFAKSTFKKECALFSAVLLIIFVAWIGLEGIVIAGQGLGILLWTAAHLAFLLFFASLEIGFLQICLGLYDGRKPKIANAFVPWSLGLEFLAGQVLYLIIVVIGTLLLIVPGVYLGVRYALFGLCLADSRAGLVHSFRKSAILSAGTWTKQFGILAALVLLNLLGASLVGVGLFVTIPVSVLVATAIYRQLSLTGMRIRTRKRDHPSYVSQSLPWFRSRPWIF